MNHKLSFVMPCYNCVSTLEEAVASVFTQNLTTPFEIVMVEDGATDNTKELIVELAKKYPKITYYSHEKNKGGGAARNTGIAKSTGDLIYCLDSDNFIAPNMMQKMIDCLDEKQTDGVAFYERRIFKGTNSKKYESQFGETSDKAITLTNLFGEHPVALDNFLYTKKAFLETDGYPEHHGFDTQCFEFRFLSTGHKIHFCPESVCYHRQGAKEKTYFERVYESGDFSKNMYLIYEEKLFLFSPVTRKFIINYDIFQNSALDSQSILEKVNKLCAENKNEFFIKNLEKYLSKDGGDKYFEDHKNSPEITDLFCSSVYHYRKGNFNESLDIQKKLLKEGLDSKITYYNILRNMVSIANPGKKTKIEKMTSGLLDSMQSKKQKIDLRSGIFRRIKRKIYRILSHSK